MVVSGAIGLGLLLSRTASGRQVVRRRFCRADGSRGLCGLLLRLLWDWSERRRGNAGVRYLAIRRGKPELKLPEPGWQRAGTAAVVVRRRRMPVWQAIKPGLQIGQRPRWRPRCQSAPVRPANASLHCGWPGLSRRLEGAGTDGVSAHVCRGDVGGGGFRGGGFRGGGLCGRASCCRRARGRAGDRQFRVHLSSLWWQADRCLAGRGRPGGRGLRWLWRRCWLCRWCGLWRRCRRIGLAHGVACGVVRPGARSERHGGNVRSRRRRGTAKVVGKPGKVDARQVHSALARVLWLVPRVSWPRHSGILPPSGDPLIVMSVRRPRGRADTPAGVRLRCGPRAAAVPPAECSRSQTRDRSWCRQARVRSLRS